MALRLRRGTDAERVTITPQAGELIYVIDTKKVWVGDGLTQGGVPVDSTLGSLSINDLTDVDTISTPPQNGEALVWNSVDAEWQPQPVVTFESDPSVNGNLKVNIVGSDSTLLVDSDNNLLKGTLDGDVNGSVFADDSSVMVDAINNELTADTVQAHVLSNDGVTRIVDNGNGNVKINNIITTGNLVPSNNLFVFADDPNELVQSLTLQVATELPQPTLNFRYKDTASDLSLPGNNYGRITFEREDINGIEVGGLLLGSADSLFLRFFNNGTPSTLLSVDATGVAVNAFHPDGEEQFYVNGIAKLEPQSAAPTTPSVGMIAVADGTNWDPAAKGGTPNPYPAFFDGTGWVAMA